MSCSVGNSELCRSRYRPSFGCVSRSQLTDEAGREARHGELTVADRLQGKAEDCVSSSHNSSRAFLHHHHHGKGKREESQEPSTCRGELGREFHLVTERRRLKKIFLKAHLKLGLKMV